MNASSRSLRPVDLDRVDLDGLAERARTLRSRVAWRAMRRAAGALLRFGWPATPRPPVTSASIHHREGASA